MSRKRLAVLISGRGSNLQALIDAARAQDYPAEIALVVSNLANAPGLGLAEGAGIETEVIDHRAFGKGAAGKEAFEAALAAAVDARRIDYLCLAGFMRLLSAAFVGRFDGRILNIHPSLLPAFKGLNVHEAMLAAGVKVAGCTVHFVTAGMDEGPIIGQAAVAVLPNDTADALAQRILAEEHKLYPTCVKLLCEGRARLEGGRVIFETVSGAGPPLHNPRA
ncbi:MAG: phosphoribosylglycinamide formyltransferase [Parvularculaceae bacterium]|nr:phosphoribosylglycinamide formyltransferase [Parvularculaceae bacterium]